MIFVPAWYGTRETEDATSHAQRTPSETVHLTPPWGKVWGAVDQTFLTNLKPNLTEGRQYTTTSILD